jgi:hypothetical protein
LRDRVQNGDMADESLLCAWDLTVGLDYGQFYLQTDDPYSTRDINVPRLVGAASSGTGIAQQFGMLVVLSPHQKNYQMLLRIEVWDAEPADVVSGWQEVFEADLTIGANGLIYDSPTMSSFKIPVPAGEYHAMICGQGFSPHVRPGSTTPGDRWLIRLWPCSEGHRGRRIRAWTDVIAESGFDLDAQATA